MLDINPYGKPLLSMVRAENELWDKMRIQWELNKTNNKRVAINMRVRFVFKRRLIALLNAPLEYTIDKDSTAKLILANRSICVRLDDEKQALENDGYFCYFVGAFRDGDILPGFLDLG